MNSDTPSLGNLTTFGIPCLCTMHYMIKHGLIMCKTATGEVQTTYIKGEETRSERNPNT